MSSLLHRSGLWLSLTAAVLPTAGCASYGYGGGYGGSSYGGGGYGYGGSSQQANLSSDEQLLREQSGTFVQDNALGGAATGAVIGCVAGTLLAALLGARGGSMAIGCGAGAAAGGIAGGAQGYMQGQEAQTQANQVLATRASTKDIEQENARLQSAVATAQRVVDSDQQKLDQIKAELAARTITLDDARAQAAVIRDNTTQIAAILDAARKNRDNYIAARNSMQGTDTSALDQQIAQLNNEIASLETQLASVNTTLALTGLN
jgi:hypothetical protein